MGRREATLEFVQNCRAAASVGDIARLLFLEMEACGIRYVACASHVDPLRPPRGAVAMVNYPHPWLIQFSDNRYAERDPIFFGAHTSLLPFWWREFIAGCKLAPDQRRILNEAAECGLINGFTIPIHAPGALPASCSLVPGPEGIDPLIVPDLQVMAVHAHEEARVRAGGKPRQPVVLTKRQKQCLVLAARGKSDALIGDILGITQTTARHTVEHARQRYGVSSRIQAVMYAYLDGTISLTDLSD